MQIGFSLLTLARLPYFATFASGGGGGLVGTTLPGDRPLMVVELRGKKPVDATRNRRFFFARPDGSGDINLIWPG